MERLSRRAKGRYGEEVAVEYLNSIGYSILVKNYRNRFGEIDLIAMDGKTTVFIEVKTRNTDTHGLPADAVDMRKRQRLVKVASAYISERKITDHPVRFDVVSIIKDRIELFKDAFESSEGLKW